MVPKRPDVGETPWEWGHRRSVVVVESRTVSIRHSSVRLPLDPALRPLCWAICIVPRVRRARIVCRRNWVTCALHRLYTCYWLGL